MSSVRESVWTCSSLSDTEAVLMSMNHFWFIITWSLIRDKGNIKLRSEGVCSAGRRGGVKLCVCKRFLLLLLLLSSFSSSSSQLCPGAVLTSLLMIYRLLLWLNTSSSPLCDLWPPVSVTTWCLLSVLEVTSAGSLTLKLSDLWPLLLASC